MSKEWPIGLGARLNQKIEKRPAYPIDNTVIWVNPNMISPFNFKIGERSPLGMQFQTAEDGLVLHHYFDRIPRPNALLGIQHEHTRCGILGRIVIADNQGNLYRDIDLKGVGKPTHPPSEGDYPSAPLGLFDYECALYDAEMAEILTAKGIKTSRTLAILRLNELYDAFMLKGEIQYFKDKGIINPDRVPVIAVRAFSVKTRIIDLENYDFDGTADWTGHVSPLFADGIASVNAQYGLKLDSNHPQEYLKWLAKTSAEQLALIHLAGKCHRYISRHNVTVDGRIVDYDSLEPFSKSEARSDIMNLSYLWKYMWLPLNREKELTGITYETYHKVYNK